MRAALLSEYHEDFVVDTVPDPEITAPDDVIVRVGAAGFCRTDIHMWDGQFDAMQKGAGVGLPFICGHENAGWVAEVGAGVHHLSVGDPVLLHPMATCGYCHFCRAARTCTAPTASSRAFSRRGFAEYVRTNARAVVPLPAGLTPVDVAPSATRITAYHAVKAIPYAVPGSSTVVLGAGGLGHIGIQALRAMSATEIIVVDRSPAALEHALEWGADHTVLRVRTAHTWRRCVTSPAASARRWSSTTSARAAERDAVEVLGAKGVDFLVGYGGTLQVKILEEGLFPETSFVSCIVGPYNELVELVRLAARGSVRLTSTTFPLEGINDALHALDEGRLVGRGVLVPNES